MNVFSVQMHYGEDADLVATNSVEHTIRKVVGDGPADVAVKDLVLLRICLNPFQSGVDFGNQLLAETFLLPFVPFCCTSNVSLRPTSDE